VAFITGIIIIVHGLRRNTSNFNTIDSTSDEQKTIALRYVLTVLQLITGISAIIQIEMTIKVNNIDLSAAPFTSSGQLMSLLIGCFTVVAVFGTGLKPLVQKLQFGQIGRLSGHELANV
jgi:hypothetical protein